jgi:hypothetical protein
MTMSYAGHFALKKQPPKKLRVTVRGQRMPGQTAADVFVASLDAIGLERVASLGLRIGPNAIVSDAPHPKDRSSKRRGNWYVLTHSSTREKQALLHQIGNSLGVDLEVGVIDPNDFLSIDFED